MFKIFRRIGAVLAAVMLLWSFWPRPDPPGLVQALVWPEEFGTADGLSGLVMEPNGLGFVALSDRGALISADVTRDESGQILAVSAPRVSPLMPPDQANWSNHWYHFDSEGLARLPDGTFAISFEALHRVSLHDPEGHFTGWIPISEMFTAFSVNQGLEGVTVTPEGRIYALPEGWINDRLPVFQFDETAGWSVSDFLSAERGFRPVGLDRDEVGRLYLLERRWSWLGGFSSRIRRFMPIGDGDLLEAQTLLQTPPGRHGNLEGLSLWQRSDGTLMATMIADNDFRRWLPRDLVEYELPVR